MIITFLIGNGFDLAAGVNTSYKCFYDWYCNQPSATPRIENFKQDIKNGGEYWSDFELGLGKYTEYFSTETVEQFWDCYNDAQQNIAKYLDYTCKGYDFKFEGNSKNKAQNAVAQFYAGTSPTENRLFKQLIEADRANNSEINILSFNYTDILDKYINRIADSPLMTWKYNGNSRMLKINTPIIHVHGFIREYPIIGVNDASQIAHQELLQLPMFGDALLKPNCVSALGQLWHEQAEAAISQSQIVCIYGMSLGATDAKWWEKLVDWMKANDRRHLVIFWHTANVVNTVSIIDRFKAENEIRDKFFSHANTDDHTKDSLRKRIHICINYGKLFPIILTKEQVEQDSVAALSKSIRTTTIV